MEAKTFRDAYDILQRHAATLRQQDEPNIDDLLDIVNESVAAYKVCKLRIDAVEKALEEALVSAGLEGNSRSAKAAPSSTDSTEAWPTSKADDRSSGNSRGSFDEMDDDIPF